MSGSEALPSDSSPGDFRSGGHVDTVAAAAKSVVPPLDTHIDQFAQDTQEYLRTFLQLADQKAAFVFTAAGALLAALYSSKAHERIIREGIAGSFCGVIALVALVALAIAAGCAVAVVFPRESRGGSGLLYWRHIQTYRSRQEYADAIMRLTYREVVQERLNNCRDLSDVCDRKYSVLRIGFWTGVVGTVATLVYFTLCALST